MAGKPWSEEEIEILKSSYKEEWETLLPKLPLRTKPAIKLKMNSLGLSKKKVTPEDVEYIKANFKEKSSRQIAKDLGYKSNTPVIRVLKELGLQRLSEDWERKEINTGVNEDGLFVKIKYEMSDRRVTE